MPPSMETARSPLLPENERRESKPRPRQWSTKQCFAVGILLLVLYVLFLRWTRTSVPKVVAHEFGVAFDLTSPYGTAAISYPNGTIINVAKIDASPAYRQMMSRLSLRSSEHLNSPCNELSDCFSILPHEVFRFLRKEAGLPASSDVGELAKLITSLKLAVEAHLDGYKISGAAITTPNLAALYQEDLLDAFEYAGLIHISPNFPYNFGRIFSEPDAVYIGNGFGLCSNYTDHGSCEEEERHSWNQTYQDDLFISYTTSMLTSTWSKKILGYHPPNSDVFRHVNPNLGWDQRNENPNDEHYWEAVRKALLRPVLEGSTIYHGNFSKVFLFGDCSTEVLFRQTLKGMIGELEGTPIIYEMDPVYLAARGAAEMAKIVQWKYKQTY